MRKTRRTLLKSVGAIASLAVSRGLSAENTSEPAQEHKLPTPSGPTAVRCVVTGQMKSGKSVIVSQAPVPPVTVALMPGYEFYRLWGNDDHPVLPSDGTPTEQAPWFPPKHGFRFAMFDHPGMHTTDSVDFDVVVFGEVVLELDDGVEALLKPGDCVVQNGTRHAWHNRSAEKCMLVSCLIGAERKRFSSGTGGEGN
jgi:mannose-6-phosphate isomerase-like protein (cupin superfamily)